jgi:hypothetical protein
MKTTQRLALSVGLVLASGLTGSSYAAEAASPETSPSITIHVYNYAGVPTRTIAEAEEVAKEIFRKAGVHIQWVDTALTGKNGQANSAGHPGFTLTDLQLNIYPRVISDRDGVPNNVLGLAPGNGPDRTTVYIFYSNVEARFWCLMGAQGCTQLFRPLSMAKILGHTIAHEIGHLLLNQQAHSAHGIMRGEWDFADFRDMADGIFLFTPHQTEFLRAEVRRRTCASGLLWIYVAPGKLLSPA